jgi:hypothetical protein
MIADFVARSRMSACPSRVVVLALSKIGPPALEMIIQPLRLSLHWQCYSACQCKRPCCAVTALISAAPLLSCLINLFRPRRAEQARRGAMDAGQYAAAVAAVKEKGVLSGKRVERRESGSPGEFAELENMTADELVQFIQEGIAPTAGKRARGRREQLN